MLSLRRIPQRTCFSVIARGNATLQPTDAASAPTPPPPPAQTKEQSAPKTTANTKSSGTTTTSSEGAKKTRARQYPSVRPSITLERPRQYSRPIGRGVLPAYDLALQYIKQDSKNLKDELDSVKAELEKGGKSPEEVEQLQKKVNILEIQSEINLPSVRWKARNGMADLSKPVYRRLVEQRWREQGALDLLMERIHQMNVVPDLLPSLHPSIDLRLNFPEAPPADIVRRTRMKRKYEKVEPGVFLLPEQTRRAPNLYVSVFHPEPRLYTLLMVDLDVPDPESNSFQAYLHWMQPNISLSASSSVLELTSTHTPYIPPHPQKGTPYHRYVVLLLPQSGAERIKIPQITEADRLGFDFRSLAEQYGLQGSEGGGAHMWREIWNPTVSHIYKETLKREEPIFGRLQKPNPYAEIKKTPKYI